MRRVVKRNRILIPDVPPPANGARDELVLVGVAILCAVVAIIAILYVYFGL